MNLVSVYNEYRYDATAAVVIFKILPGTIIGFLDKTMTGVKKKKKLFICISSTNKYTKQI